MPKIIIVMIERKKIPRELHLYSWMEMWVVLLCANKTNTSTPIKWLSNLGLKKHKKLKDKQKWTISCLINITFTCL